MTNHLENALRKLGNPFFVCETDGNGQVWDDDEPYAFASKADFDAFRAREAEPQPVGDPRTWILLDCSPEFGDAWIKIHSAPEPEDFRRWIEETLPESMKGRVHDLSNEEAESMFSVQEPGHHPGGRQWWINPSFPVSAYADGEAAT